MSAYYIRTPGGYVPTALRPSTRDRQRLERETAELREQQKRHNPGDGWHYVPGPIEFRHNGRYWFASAPTSEGAILAHLDDICRLRGLDLATVYASAYPGDWLSPLTEAERAACARPATDADIPAVLNDLTDVNYHALRDSWDRVTEALNQAMGIVQ